jgi:hypothetical protein
MRTAAFMAARQMRADLCWSLDSDVLPPANAYRCMLAMLEFDAGYYGVSTCSYPNDSYLGGRGNHRNPILPTIYPDERELSKPLAVLIDRAAKPDAKRPPERMALLQARLNKWVEASPPKGNVFELNARGWRPRGWLESAYPAIGKGSVLPTDWCGFGCTLLGVEALAHAHFDGYEGQGTEDLWICYQRWAPVGIRINVIPHVVCDHVLRNAKRAGAKPTEPYTHLRAYHEQDGDCAGHLRTSARPYVPI